MDSSLPPRASRAPRGLPADPYPRLISTGDSRPGMRSSSKFRRRDPTSRRSPARWLSWSFVPQSTWKSDGWARNVPCPSHVQGLRPSSREFPADRPAFAGALSGFTLQSIFIPPIGPRFRSHALLPFVSCVRPRCAGAERPRAFPASGRRPRRKSWNLDSGQLSWVSVLCGSGPAPAAAVSHRGSPLTLSPSSAR